METAIQDPRDSRVPLMTREFHARAIRRCSAFDGGTEQRAAAEAHDALDARRRYLADSLEEGLSASEEEELRWLAEALAALGEYAYGLPAEPCPAALGRGATLILIDESPILAAWLVSQIWWGDVPVREILDAPEALASCPEAAMRLATLAKAAWPTSDRALPALGVVLSWLSPPSEEASEEEGRCEELLACVSLPAAAWGVFALCLTAGG